MHAHKHTIICPFKYIHIYIYIYTSIHAHKHTIKVFCTSSMLFIGRTPVLPRTPKRGTRISSSCVCGVDRFLRVCMYVCVCVYVCVVVCVCLYIYVYMDMRVYVCQNPRKRGTHIVVVCLWRRSFSARMYVCMCVCVCVCVYVYIWTCVCMYVRTPERGARISSCVCGVVLCMCVYVCMCVCMYIHT